MGIPEQRIGGKHGIRVFDTVLALVVLWIILFILQWKAGKMKPQIAVFTSFGLALIVLFPLAIIVHAVFGIPTSLNCKLHLASQSKCGAKRDSAQ